ncbi:XRE family transcriptional regulator [Mycobacterium sp. 360MFTsu5.1]|uniref:XRE family transcriptional regulator n=1 Tax=Mycobacterium sp. 360MFTsu5.1 TaxID=1172186 RepID=UPI0004902F5E|nr:XRE family transcriptional regulator [Mycobacterium sp. 360MFTsu5.1]
MTDEDQGELRLFGERGSSLDEIVRAFDSARLTQARVLAELTKVELAERLGVSAAAVGQYETGATKPRHDLLPQLSRVLRVPVEFFAAGRPIGRLDAANAHFRSLRSTRAKDRAKAATHAEQLWELTYALEKRVRLPEVDVPTFPEGTPPAHAAQTLRKAWGIARGPLPHLVALMESRGIVVSLIAMTNEAVRRVSAYSTDALGRPLVIVTPEKAFSVYTYRFTCAHELGHLVLHSSPLPGDRQQEREADEFAAEFLTPQAEIGPLLPRTMRMAALEKLSVEWGVSVKSLIRRMGALGVVSDVSVRRAYQRLSAAAELSRHEPISVYKGEVPSLLRDAFTLAERYGLTRRELAIELGWTAHHLDEMLGDDDKRPVLRIVR